MFNDSIQKLAHTLVNYSTKIQPGDLVFIHGKGFETQDLAQAVASKTLQAGGVPYVYFEDERITRNLLLEGNEAIFQQLGEFLLQEMKQAQVYLGIRGSANAFELADVPQKQMDLYDKYIVGPVHIEQRVKHTRWCIMRYPNPAMAQLAQTSCEAFTRFYYDVCGLDYSKMDQAVLPLRQRMEETDRVRIVAPGTDLRFSIQEIPVIPCSGTNNIPDGECFTAPVRDSIQGTICFNTPSIHEGVLYESIQLTFEQGKVVNMDAGIQTERLKKVLTSDEGASYVGEFSFGYNPYILHPMKDTLFDEKIAGSLHMALGSCYEEASNGNNSTLHWDLVLIQRPQYGGGEVYFDDCLIRKDGLFVLPELEGLNPENFKS